MKKTELKSTHMFSNKEMRNFIKEHSTDRNTIILGPARKGKS